LDGDMKGGQTFSKNGREKLTPTGRTSAGERRLKENGEALDTLKSVNETVTKVGGANGQRIQGGSWGNKEAEVGFPGKNGFETPRGRNTKGRNKKERGGRKLKRSSTRGTNKHFEEYPKRLGKTEEGRGVTQVQGERMGAKGVTRDLRRTMSDEENRRKRIRRKERRTGRKGGGKEKTAKKRLRSQWFRKEASSAGPRKKENKSVASFGAESHCRS